MPPDLTPLREKIARLEAGGPANLPNHSDHHRAIPLGLPAVDAALPAGGLRRGAVHEVMFPHPADGAATGFALRILSRLASPDSRFLWSGCRDDLHSPGFVPFIDPSQMLFARAQKMQDVLWSVEEGLRCPELTAIVADVAPVDFTLSRRLSLAAADSGGMVLMLMPYRYPLPASAAMTRWRIACAPDGCWQLDLLRCKGGRPGSWLANSATGGAIPPHARAAHARAA